MLIRLLFSVDEKGIHFQSAMDGIDTTTPAGRFFFHVMASLAQMERELLIERTKAGLVAAKKRGRVGGRKRLMTPSKVEAAKKLLAQGMPPKEVTNNLGVSIPTLYRWCPASDNIRDPQYIP
ncbi:MAG: recombinase family protein [Desulfobacteraceae bacterium]|nr:recombinase family protein [Desulfobacteraceae bacterium]